MTTGMTTPTEAIDQEEASFWWVFLLTGALWIIFGFVVLSFDITTVYAIAIFLGIGFIAGGVVELGLSAIAEDGKWLYILFGLVSIGAGIVALVWPEQTFVVVAVIVAWLVLLHGVLDVVTGLATRHDNDLWWLQLLVGALEIAVGVWAIGYTGRSIALLVIWVGVAALFRGISHIVLAFGLRGVGKELSAVTGT
jgi:uncharacterized membrane protein HdeD (DUF308 family)